MYYVSYNFMHFPPTFILISLLLNTKHFCSMTKKPTIPHIYMYTDIICDSSYNKVTMLCSIQ